LNAADQAACRWFGEYGGALEGVGTVLALTPEPISTKIGVGLILANAAAQTGCNYDTSKSGEQGRIDGCSEISGGYGNLNVKYDGIDWTLTTVSNCPRLCAIKEIEPEPSKFNGAWGYYGRFSCWDDGDNPPCSDSLRTFLALGITEERARTATFKLVPVTGSCSKTDKPGIQPPEITDEPYTDPDTGCQLNVKFLGYAEGPSGSLFQITQMDPVLPEKASGGVIGGCNFNSSIVVNNIGGGGGDSNDPPIVIPNPPNPPAPENPGEEWWAPYVKAALGGVVAGITEEILENLIAGSAPSMVYRAVSVCEKDASGEPISEAVEIQIPELKAPDAQIARLDAIVELLQAHKNFKQPICGKDKPPLAGQWVTTRWESDEKMVDSGRRLRKLFRYRTQSTRDLGQLSDYWRDFVWRSGPVCVRHTGAWWGDPQVWAESAEEGQRVIRHAATEAGLDPDQTGGWAISSSRSPRYGMSGTMKILKKEGFPWVASRDGSDWPNMLAS
jgi:hypothetical protein